MKLYELSQSYNQIYDLVEDEEVDIEVLADTLESIEDSIDKKFENISKMIKDFDGKAETFKKEEERLSKKRKSIENKVKWLKGYMLDTLNVMDRTKVEAGTFVVRKQKNPPSVVIIDQAKLDERYIVKQPDKVDSKLLAKDMKEGIAVVGAEFAPDSFHLRIQ